MTHITLPCAKKQNDYIANVVIAGVFVILVGLGVWQSYRSVEKSARLQQIEERMLNQALPLSDVLEQQDWQDFPAILTGSFDRQAWFFIDNKLHNGIPGYHLVGLFHTQQHQLLVDLGWIEAPLSREQLPTIELPSGEVTFEAILVEHKTNPFISETQPTPKPGAVRLQQLDYEVIQAWTEQPLLRVTALVNDDFSPQLVRDWQAVVMPPEKHIAYAVQWFGLAIAVLLVFFFAKQKKGDANE